MRLWAAQAKTNKQRHEGRVGHSYTDSVDLLSTLATVLFPTPPPYFHPPPLLASNQRTLRRLFEDVRLLPTSSTASSGTLLFAVVCSTLAVDVIVVVSGGGGAAAAVVVVVVVVVVVSACVESIGGAVMSGLVAVTGAQLPLHVWSWNTPPSGSNTHWPSAPTQSVGGGERVSECVCQCECE